MEAGSEDFLPNLSFLLKLESLNKIKKESCGFLVCVEG